MSIKWIYNFEQGFGPLKNNVCLPNFYLIGVDRLSNLYFFSKANHNTVNFSIK